MLMTSKPLVAVVSTFESKLWPLSEACHNVRCLGDVRSLGDSAAFCVEAAGGLVSDHSTSAIPDSPSPPVLL
jgi:hypothetical protein